MESRIALLRITWNRESNCKHDTSYHNSFQTTTALIFVLIDSEWCILKIHDPWKYKSCRCHVLVGFISCHSSPALSLPSYVLAQQSAASGRGLSVRVVRRRGGEQCSSPQNCLGGLSNTHSGPGSRRFSSKVTNHSTAQPISLTTLIVVMGKGIIQSVRLAGGFCEF